MASSRKTPAKSTAISKTKVRGGTLKRRPAAAKTTKRLPKPSRAKAKTVSVKRRAADAAKTRRAASASAKRTVRFRSRSPLKPALKFRASSKAGKPKKAASAKPAAAKSRLSGTRKTRASIVKRCKPLSKKPYKKFAMVRADEGFKDFIRSLVLGKLNNTH